VSGYCSGNNIEEKKTDNCQSHDVIKKQVDRRCEFEGLGQQIKQRRGNQSAKARVQIFNKTCNKSCFKEKREAISNMANRLELQRFKNREHIIAEIRRCALAGSVSQYLSILFAALGVIGDASNVKLGLDPTAWFLLAIFATVHAIVPHLHLVVAKHLLGIEAENKKE
jgi:hypothetical protein